jgi:uncharacterized protein
MPRDAALTDQIGQELRLIREHVPGVRGSVAATADGILIADDVHDLEPTQIAALVAAMHAVAVRVTLSTDSGQLRDVITRASDGCLAVYAVGRAAIIAVLGTAELNIAILNYQSRPIVDRVADHLSNLARRPQTNPGYPPTTPWAPPGRPDTDGAAPLPSRRPSAT